MRNNEKETNALSKSKKDQFNQKKKIQKQKKNQKKKTKQKIIMRTKETDKEKPLKKIEHQQCLQTTAG